MYMRHFLAVVAAFACLAAMGPARAADPAPGASAPRAKFDPARDAAADVAAAVARARAQGKRVIVDVGGEWCTWCHILDRFVASEPDVKKRVDTRFVWVKVNFSKENKNEAVLGKWPKVAGFPHLFVLDASGQLLPSQNTGELESEKTYDKAKFIAFLDQAAGSK